MSNYWLDKKKQREEAEAASHQTVYVSIWDFERELAEEIKKAMEPIWCAPASLNLSDTISSDQVKISDFTIDLTLDLGPYDAPEYNPKEEKGWELDL